MPGYLKYAMPLLFLFALAHGPASQSAEFELSSGKKQTTLIELFTSQGCSSCPPAERWLSNLQRDPRLWREIIPVAFHVDYWDYIGWKDQLARPAFSARQIRYKKENGVSTVYTPGFVINGKEWRPWFGLKQIPSSESEVGELQLKLKHNRLQARYVPSQGVGEALILNVAVLGVGLIADVTRGENAGRKLPQDFVVLEHLHGLSKNGQWSMALPAHQPQNGSRLAIAAWVSSIDRQAPLQAVGGWLPKD